MTTKEAIDLAVYVLKQNPKNEDRVEAAEILMSLQKKDLISHWTKESILKALDEWARENGRPPRVTNLIEPGMPGASIIQKHFQMRASALLNKRYGEDVERIERQNQYGFNSQEDWINCFKEQFIKHCNEDGFSSNTYNLLKDKGTPLWTTIARHCGTTRWSKLMELASVNYPSKRDTAKQVRVGSVKSPWLDKFETAIKKQEELDRELINTINRKQK